MSKALNDLKSRFNQVFLAPASPRLTKQELLSSSTLNLKRIDEEGKPRIYDDGTNKFYSVTSILSECDRFDKSYLEVWTEYVGKIAAETSTKKAATRGTLVHEALESWIKRKDYDSNFVSNPLCVRLFNQCVSICQERVQSFIGSEVMVKSHLGFSGTIDAFGYVWDDNFERLCPAIIDFKNYRTKKTKEDLLSAFYQVALYSIALSDTFGFETDSAMILSSDESSDKGICYFINRSDFARLKTEARALAVQTISKMRRKYGTI